MAEEDDNFLSTCYGLAPPYILFVRGLGELRGEKGDSKPRSIPEPPANINAWDFSTDLHHSTTLLTV